MAAAAPSGYSVIGQGSYGRVISPALPNQINGKRVNFPGHVTKLYFTEKTYHNAQASSKRIQDIIGKNERLHMEPYQYPYTAKNLPRNILQGLESTVIQANDQPVYMAHTPHLGYSLVQAVHHPRMIDRMRSMPIGHFLLEVARMFRQTEAMFQNGMIHGDITINNILYNPNTHIFSIIDYDLMTDTHTFVEKSLPYRHFTYPPETFLVEAKNNPMIVYNDEAQTDHYAHIAFNIYRPYWVSQGIQDEVKFREILVKSIQHSQAYLQQQIDAGIQQGIYQDGGQGIEMILSSMIDNYSLSLCILAVMEIIYPGVHDPSPENVAKHLKAVLDPRVHQIQSDADWEHLASSLSQLSGLLSLSSSFYIEERPSPQMMSEQLGSILRQHFHIAVSGGRNRRHGHKLRRTHQRRRNPNAKTHRKPAAKKVVG